MAYELELRHNGPPVAAGRGGRPVRPAVVPRTRAAHPAFCLPPFIQALDTRAVLAGRHDAVLLAQLPYRSRAPADDVRVLCAAWHARAAAGLRPDRGHALWLAGSACDAVFAGDRLWYAGVVVALLPPSPDGVLWFDVEYAGCACVLERLLCCGAAPRCSVTCTRRFRTRAIVPEAWLRPRFVPGDCCVVRAVQALPRPRAHDEGRRCAGFGGGESAPGAVRCSGSHGWGLCRGACGNQAGGRCVLCVFNR